MGAYTTSNESIYLAFRWIEKSIKIKNGKGSASYYHLLKGWGPAYPETSGYLIPSLIAYHKLFPNSTALDLVKNINQWLLSIESKEGNIVGSPEDPNSSYVFDNGQVLLGYCALYTFNPKLIDKARIEKLSVWLLHQMDDDGRFSKTTYVHNYCPAYLSRTLWALYEAKNIVEFSDERIQKIEDSLRYFLQLKQDNHYFYPCAFSPKETFALTHNIAYNLRALLEIAQIEQNDDLLEIVTNSAKAILKIYTQEKKMPGSFDKNWNGDVNYECVTGSLQLAIVFNRLSRRTDDTWNKASRKLIDGIKKKQFNRGFSSIKGGLFSSIPFYGQYQRFKVTNWTMKFYLDALLSQHEND